MPIQQPSAQCNTGEVSSPLAGATDRVQVRTLCLDGNEKGIKAIGVPTKFSESIPLNKQILRLLQLVRGFSTTVNLDPHPFCIQCNSQTSSLRSLSPLPPTASAGLPSSSPPRRAAIRSRTPTKAAATSVPIPPVVSFTPPFIFHLAPANEFAPDRLRLRLVLGHRFLEPCHNPQRG